MDAYTHLRMAWERAVEEVLLRNVVLRFRKGIETQRLIGVVVEDDDFTFGKHSTHCDAKRARATVVPDGSGVSVLFDQMQIEAGTKARGHDLLRCGDVAFRCAHGGSDNDSD